jgi:hypothetical protein
MLRRFFCMEKRQKLTVTEGRLRVMALSDGRASDTKTRDS